MDDKKKTLVSIIISAYNAEKYIESCVNSVLNQTYSNIEIIVVDDCSTDNTGVILDSYSDKRLIVIHNEANCGLTVNLNKAILISHGEYIARLDSDDICCKDRIAKQLEFMYLHPEVDVLGSNAYLIDENDNIKGVTDETIGDVRIKEKVVLLNPFIHPTVFFKADVLKKYMYNEAFRSCQDFELWVRMQKNIHFENMKEPLLYYRLNFEGVTRKARKEPLARKKVIEPIISSSIEKNKIDLEDKEIDAIADFMVNNVDTLNVKILIDALDKIPFTYRYLCVLLIRNKNSLKELITQKHFAIVIRGIGQLLKYYFRIVICILISQKERGKLVEAKKPRYS